MENKLLPSPGSPTARFSFSAIRLRHIQRMFVGGILSAVVVCKDFVVTWSRRALRSLIGGPHFALSVFFGFDSSVLAAAAFTGFCCFAGLGFFGCSTAKLNFFSAFSSRYYRNAAQSLSAQWACKHMNAYAPDGCTTVMASPVLPFS